ncbi:heterokaryon incompatibility protein [Rutstroemia sp. NJR-2017a BVV2]|nr:heterokaryon incompatibility protein [Rutstroemia sp. NJR-2017a BVV2]
MCIMRLDGISFSADTDELHLEIIYPSLGWDIVECLLTLLWKRNETRVKVINLAAAAIPGTSYDWKLYVKITDEFLTETPAALYTPCRPLNRWPSSKGTMAWVRERLDICHTQHFNCRVLRDRLPPGRPSRLLYICDNRSTEFKVVPMAGRAIPPYVALSYCWGDGIQVGVCTTANLSTLLEGMDLCELPLTIRDAVQVATASGISWLWVDRLCIVQDDPQDLEVELRNMAGIYANASLVLSAACAQNSVDGFLSTREAPQNILLPFDIAGDEPDTCSCTRSIVSLIETLALLIRGPGRFRSMPWPIVYLDLEKSRPNGGVPKLISSMVDNQAITPPCHTDPAYSKAYSFNQKTR